MHQFLWPTLFCSFTSLLFSLTCLQEISDAIEADAKGIPFASFKENDDKTTTVTVTQGSQTTMFIAPPCDSVSAFKGADGQIQWPER